MRETPLHRRLNTGEIREEMEEGVPRVEPNDVVFVADEFLEGFAAVTDKAHA